MKNENYESPLVEVVEVEIEKGFAISDVDSKNTEDFDEFEGVW